MTYSIKLTSFTAALMDGAARAAGCSVEALLAGTICSWQSSARRATATPVLEEAPEHRAALPHVAAPAAAVAPAQPSLKLTRAERRAARAAELERLRRAHAGLLHPDACRFFNRLACLFPASHPTIAPFCHARHC